MKRKRLEEMMAIVNPPTFPLGQVPGGINYYKADLAQSQGVAEFDPREMKMGIRWEMRQAGDLGKAVEMVLDHLSEDPSYYSKMVRAGLGDGVDDKFLPRAGMGMGIIRSMA